MSKIKNDVINRLNLHEFIQKPYSDNVYISKLHIQYLDYSGENAVIEAIKHCFSEFDGMHIIATLKHNNEW